MSKTLNKTITSRFFATEGGYDEMRRRWSAAVNDKETRKTLTSSHHALYVMLSGKNLGKSFTPITGQARSHFRRFQLFGAQTPTQQDKPSRQPA